MVTCEPVEGYLLEVVSSIDVKRSGSGTPSPDNVRAFVEHSAVNLTRCGKNLLPYPYISTTDTYNGIEFTSNNDGSITMNGTATAAMTYVFQTINLVKDTTYTFTTGLPVTSGQVGIYIFLPDWSSSWYITHFAKSFTPTSTAEYKVCIYIPSGYTVNNMVAYPQLEFGTTATAYEPYIGNAFTMDLGKNIYGGSLDWNSGLLTIGYGSIVFDGVTNGKKFTATDPKAKTYAYLSTSGNTASKLGGKSYCNQAEYITIAGSSGTAIVITIGKTYTGVVDEDDMYAVTSKFNALAKQLHNAGTPLIAVYELKTPITVQLTPQQITALAGVNTIYSNTGNTIVTGKADPIAEIEKLKNAILATGDNI